MKVRTQYALAVAVLTAVAGLASNARAATSAINLPAQMGNQSYGKGLGIDFTVNATITITSLGVFDDLENGISQTAGVDNTLTAVLYNSDDQIPLATLTFTTSDAGTLTSGFRYKALGTALTLQPGHYDIAGYGFNAQNLNYNSAAGVPTDNGGGAIAYTGVRYSTLNPPDNMQQPPEGNDGAVIKYGAASFLFNTTVTFNRTWSGAGANALWSTGSNWVEGPLTNNNPLIFGAAVKQSNTNDLSGYTANGLKFTTGGFTIGGNDFTISDSFINQTGANTINNNLTLTGSGTSIAVAAGTLTLNGAVSAPFAPGGGFQFVTKSGAGTLVLNGANNLQSGLLVNGGTARLADIGDGGTSSLGAPGQGDNAVAGLLGLYSGTLEVTGSGSQTTARRIYADQPGSPVLSVTSSTGRIVLTGQYRSNGTVAASLGKAGPGTLALEGNDPFFAATGGDRAYNFMNAQGGTLELGRSAGTAVDGITDILPGATVKLTGASGDQIFVDALGAYGDGVAHVGGELPGLVKLSGGTFDLNGHSESINRLESSVATSVVRNGSATAATLTVGEANLNGNFTATYAGTIVNGTGPLAITKTGAATTVIFTGSTSYSGQTTVTGGVLRLGTSASGVVLNGGGTDIQNGRIEFDYSGGTTNVATIRGLLASSYGTNFTGGKFRNSTATSQRGLGYLDDTANSRVIVAAALYGDANLDGSVKFGDLLALAQNFGLMTNAQWAQGDFNYDSKVNFTDLLKLAQNFNVTLMADQASLLTAAGGSDFIADWALAQSLVPEPTMLSLAGVAAGALVRRRPITG